MGWFYLVMAGITEIGFALGLKYSNGFTKLWPSLGFVAAASASFYLLTRAMQSIPIGTAYAVWTGIGAAGIAVAGILFLGEQASGLRIFFLSLLVVAIVGLKVAAPE